MLLHDAPYTLHRVHDSLRWLLPALAVLFALLAIGAAFDALPWDRPITRWVVAARRPWLDQTAKTVTFLGSTPVVILVVAVCALAAWPRSRPLAVAIVLLAIARPVIEVGLKELIQRDRPPAEIRLTRPRGYSFPSGHPFATAASWGFVPLVVHLYTCRRAVWWGSVVAVWTLAVAVAASRVWVGVHWTSDVVGGLALAVLGVAGAERVIDRAHRAAA